MMSEEFGVLALIVFACAGVWCFLFIRNKETRTEVVGAESDETDIEDPEYLRAKAKAFDALDRLTDELLRTHTENEIFSSLPFTHAPARIKLSEMLDSGFKNHDLFYRRVSEALLTKKDCEDIASICEMSIQSLRKALRDAEDEFIVRSQISLPRDIV